MRRELTLKDTYKRNVLYHPYDGGYTTVHICQNSLKCMLKIFELYAFHILIKLMGCSPPKMVPNTVPNWSMTFLKTFFRDTWLAQLVLEEHETLDLGVEISSSMLDADITKKNLKIKILILLQTHV